MCAPVLAVMGAMLSVAQGVAGAAAQQQEAAAQNQMYMENAQQAKTAAVNQYKNLNVKHGQQREAANQDLLQQSIQGLEKRGTAAASSAEAGVSGLSVDALVGNIFAQQGRRQEATLRNYNSDSNQLFTEMQNVEANAQQRINSVKRVTPPSGAGAILGGLAGAVSSLGKLAISGAG